MKTEILSEELNAMKYLLGYKRGVVISEQPTPQFGNPNQFSTSPFAPKTQTTAAPVAAAPTTGTPAVPAPVAAAPTTGTPTASVPARNFNTDPNIGKGGIGFNRMTPEQLVQGVQSATPPKLPTRDESIAKAKADLKAARGMK